tara:strand:+ start:29 stop:157 length:129 start_codon:yes stop_codon:yes gene_type:complete
MKKSKKRSAMEQWAWNLWRNCGLFREETKMFSKKSKKEGKKK